MEWSCCKCGQSCKCTTCGCGHNFCLSCVYSRKPRLGGRPVLKSGAGSSNSTPAVRFFSRTGNGRI